jgi:hypothetical protein
MIVPAWRSLRIGIGLFYLAGIEVEGRSGHPCAANRVADDAVRLRDACTINATVFIQASHF